MRGLASAGCGPVVVLALVLLGGAVGSVAAASHETTQTCTVESKDRAAGADGKSQMRVYTADCGVFEVTDSLLKMRFDAADRYAAMLPGHRYQLTTVGFRVPFLSLFPNVIDAREVAR